ncbi:hypothetical protein [Ligilactobacillus salivarius]|uniref:Uncharacterized protein n=1 Tax=Ligilactobacillus salivarius (strain UCC118) TaxID=362948 RepID=A0JQL1_LIGS1|nr:hypothetical protein [Ligilactobacillus salivarius]ABD99581.1 Hypothetical protein, phage associated [Ligilactobacillus salivarius UCC118]OQQ76373.1 hypothetical protein B6U64_04560 [Ligilactobacillus salivarius]OQR20845.1 hypothetical protein B6U40_03960 [Ligilactobacillus salivarius]
MDFKKEIKNIERKSKEVSETAENILNLLEKNGYDDAIIVLKKDEAVGAATTNLNGNFTPMMLTFLYDQMNALSKVKFATKILGISGEELVKDMLEEKRENED